MTDLDSLIEELENWLPSDDKVLLAAAANPVAFLAIHGVCASDYIKEVHKARRVLAALRAREQMAEESHA